MSSSAVRALSLEYKSLQDEPVEGTLFFTSFRFVMFCVAILLKNIFFFRWAIIVCMAHEATTKFNICVAICHQKINSKYFLILSEGFRVKLCNDDNLFEWEVAIFGPPDTLYQGGYFKVSHLCCCFSFFTSHFTKRHGYQYWICRKIIIDVVFVSCKHT